MSTIQETVERELDRQGLGSYRNSARPVIDALVERERTISDAIWQAAEAEGIDSPQARQTLEATGLEFRPAPVQAAQANGGGEGDATLAAIQSTLQAVHRDVQGLSRRLSAAEQFASRHGFRPQR